jgi:hypothetical protein
MARRANRPIKERKGGGKNAEDSLWRWRVSALVDNEYCESV